jgi:hypothetical protein
MRLTLRIALGCCLAWSGACSRPEPQKPAEQPAPQAAPATPAIPADVEAAAQTALGSEVEVLTFGDLAKTGKQQFLAINRLKKTPTGVAPGILFTRAVVVEKDGGKWTEVLRCDEHLKNTKGYLGLTPLDPVTAWRLQYEQDNEKGLQLYFTPLQAAGTSHVLPIGVRWNPEAKRYQSLDRSYEKFLLEVPSLQNARSTLR